MSEKFKYTVTAFDSNKKIVTVEFEDKSWAQVALVTPLPIDLDELGALVSVYTQPVEHEAAVADKTADLGFITKSVGKELEANRRWMFPPETPEWFDAEIEAMIQKEIGPQGTESQTKASETLRRAFQTYEFNSVFLAGPLREKLTEKSKAEHAVFMNVLCTIIVDANTAIKNNTQYEAILPMFEMELV